MFFRPDFTYDRFALAPEEKHKSLFDYIDNLIKYSISIRKIPVLGFNRTNFRMGLMARYFDAYNIFTERDIFDIWTSC